MSPKTLLSALRKCEREYGDLSGSGCCDRDARQWFRDERLANKIEKRLLTKLDCAEIAIIEKRMNILIKKVRETVLYDQEPKN